MRPRGMTSERLARLEHSRTCQGLYHAARLIQDRSSTHKGAWQQQHASASTRLAFCIIDAKSIMRVWLTELHKPPPASQPRSARSQRAEAGSRSAYHAQALPGAVDCTSGCAPVNTVRPGRQQHQNTGPQPH